MANRLQTYDTVVTTDNIIRFRSDLETFATFGRLPFSGGKQGEEREEGRRSRRRAAWGSNVIKGCRGN